MRFTVPRWLFVGLAVLFSAYHIVLAVYSLWLPVSPLPVVVAMVLYAVVTLLSLLPGRRMPIWVAALDVAAVVMLSLLVTHGLDPARPGGNGYATWHVAAIGTLMTIVSTRRRHAFAWAGIAFLAVQTVLWGGIGALTGIGVVGSAAWVAVAHLISRAIDKAARDAQRFAVAEREASDWQAAQEAHLTERARRVEQTSATALPMLRTIRRTRGELTDAQRQECLLLEQAIRDEIRGRFLLNDAVRAQVMTARRRGAIVSVLDEGGLDELDDEVRDRMQTRLAASLEGGSADRIIIRTVPDATDPAITVVGLRSSDDPVALALGTVEDEVVLQVRITAAAAPVAAPALVE